MRLASLESDFWELESGEERQARYGDGFWLPSIEKRRGLKPGQLAKLLFVIEGTDAETGRVETQVERMWVLVTQVEREYYVGRLTNEPACIEPSEKVYLRIGAEIPFRAEHVIDVHEWAEEDVRDFLANAPYRRWPRSGG